MNKLRALNIRSTLWLVLALTVASTALAAMGLQSYWLSRQDDTVAQFRTHAIAEAYAAQLAPAVIAGRRVDLPGLLRDMQWHPDSRLLALQSPSGETWAARGTLEILDKYAELRKSQPGTRWHVRGGSEGLTPEYNLAVAPIRSQLSDQPAGTLIYAMAMPQGRSLLHARSLAFFMHVALVAAAGILFGWLWLKRRILVPLATLSSQHVDDLEQSPQTPHVNRDDEIGAIARLIAGLRGEVQEWRSRATRLERTLNVRVAHATQRITRELKQAQKKIWTDPLTRLGNRRLLDDKFAEIFNAQAESGQELSIVMMDLDNFKLLNDTLGHRAGDELLQFTGELLQQCLREQDLAVRYGGDEFVLVLPSVSPDQAQAIADRTIAMFSQRASLLPLAEKPAMSAGIASLQQHCPEDAEALLSMADAALYQVKHIGKAQASIFRPGKKPVCV